MSTGKAGEPRRPVKWPITPQIHNQIRQLYQKKVGMTKTAAVREYAEEIGYPAWKIKRYAAEQGWAIRQKKESDWSAKEIKILSRNAHLSPGVIRQRLKRRGFGRTTTAIVLKRKRLRMPQNLGGQSANKLAICFGVDAHCITRWIKLGWLKATKRHTERKPQQGGDIYFIKDKWIRGFILEHLPEIDIRKVDKYWFVDLLAGGNLGLNALAEQRAGELDTEADAGCTITPGVLRAVA